MADITVEELKEKLDNKDKFLFIDVREPAEFQEYNLAAELVPLGVFEARLNEFEDQKDVEVVVHCRSGARSASAKAIMLQHGFKNVRNLLGGALAFKEKYG